jgi:hypothetical protein
MPFRFHLRVHCPAIDKADKPVPALPIRNPPLLGLYKLLHAVFAQLTVQQQG